MSLPEYEYHGLLAQTWDLFRGDTSTWPDRDFYLGMIRGFGEPGLDVGCGTGRLLLDYLQEGIEIHGVDSSPEMLNICRKKARMMGVKPVLYLQTMETMDLPQRYQTIIVPSSSFQLLINPRKADQAMQTFSRHLHRGGALVMPFMVLWQEGDPLMTEWKSAEIFNDETGMLIRRFTRERHEPELQLEYTETFFELYSGDTLVNKEDHSQSGMTRWYTQPQVYQLYRDHGFQEIRFVEGFSYQAAEPDSRLFTAIGLKS